MLLWVLLILLLNLYFSKQHFVEHWLSGCPFFFWLLNYRSLERWLLVTSSASSNHRLFFRWTYTSYSGTNENRMSWWTGIVIWRLHRGGLNHTGYSRFSQEILNFIVVSLQFLQISTISQQSQQLIFFHRSVIWL